MNANNKNKNDTPKNYKEKLHLVVFGTDTYAGKLFDLVLIWLVLLSVALVMLESVESIKEEYAGATLEITNLKDLKN